MRSTHAMFAAAPATSPMRWARAVGALAGGSRGCGRDMGMAPSGCVDGRHFGCHGLMAEEAWLAPPVEFDGECQPQTAEEIRAHDIAEPVLAEVNPRQAHERDEQGERNQQ